MSVKLFCSSLRNSLGIACFLALVLLSSRLSLAQTQYSQQPSAAFSTAGGALQTAQRLYVILEQRLAFDDSSLRHVAEIESKLGRYVLTDRLAANVEAYAPLRAADARSYRGASQSVQVEALVMRAANAIPKERLSEIVDVASGAAKPLMRVGNVDLADRLLGVGATTAASAMAREVNSGQLLLAKVIRGYGDLGSREKLLASVNPASLKVGPVDFLNLLGSGFSQTVQDAIRQQQERTASTLTCEVASALVAMGELDTALRVFRERRGEAGNPPSVHEAAADLAAGLVRAKRYGEAETFMRLSREAMRGNEDMYGLVFKSNGRVRIAAALVEDGKLGRSEEVLNWLPRLKPGYGGTQADADKRYQEERSVERAYTLARAGRTDEAMALLRDTTPATLANGSSPPVTKDIAVQIVRGLLALNWVP